MSAVPMLLMGAARHRVWAPERLGSALRLWLDADHGPSFTFGAGSAVASWSDRRGNGQVGTQGTAGSRPTRSGSVAGRATVVFGAGVPTWLNFGDLLDLGQGLTIAAVASLTVGSRATLLSKSLAGTGGGRWAVGRANGANRLEAWYAQGGTLRVAGQDPNSSQPLAVLTAEIHPAAGVVRFRINKVQVGQTTFAADTTTYNTAQHLLLGHYGDSAGLGGVIADANFYLRGEVAEVLAFDPGSVPVGQVEAYLAGRWGL